MSTKSITPAGRTVSDTSIRDWLLFALTVSSGAVDAISFLALGKIFTAFMTGNIVFLGLAIAQDPRAPSIVGVLGAIAGFGAGISIASRIVAPSRLTVTHQGEQPLRLVWPQSATYALALLPPAHLCFLLIWIATDARPGENATVALLAVWALAMGMQSAAVRRLNVGGVFTTAATATFIFLAGSFAHEPLSGEERRRLAGVLLSLVLGATAGGLLLVHVPVYAPLFPLGISLGIVATAAAAFGYRDHRGAILAPERMTS